MKRAPNTELNQDNWDAEEQSEERGQFVTADSDVISQRKVISARRKPTTNTTGIFKSFGGFSQNNKEDVSFGLKNSSDLNKEKHLSSIKMLNQKFLDCISKHINENPCCILTPTLDDYNSHLNVIKNKYPLTTHMNFSQASENKPVSVNFNSAKSVFSCEDKNVKVPDSKLFSFSNEEKATFSFGKKEENSETNKAFSFGKKEESSVANKAFSFGLPNENSNNQTVNAPTFDFLTKKPENAPAYTFPTSSMSANTSLFVNGGA